MKTHLYETTNIHNQRIWIVCAYGHKIAFYKKQIAKQAKKILDMFLGDKTMTQKELDKQCERILEQVRQEILDPVEAIEQLKEFLKTL